MQKYIFSKQVSHLEIIPTFGVFEQKGIMQNRSGNKPGRRYRWIDR